jgi:hypothetical protein
VRNILLIDSDLGFVFWLGHILSGAGFEALPAKSVADAIALLSMLAIQIDLLIFNPYVEGAVNFAADLKRADRHLKTMAVVPEEMAVELSGVDACKGKINRFDVPARDEWLSFIQRLLSNTKTA